ncbi:MULTISPECIES: ParA family protein [unclassified Paracoccus (in: a-proteobacteria)]|uniref:ParA family protein n=1 Tax=unclassified Paracoccus (in: a-proteobacteria) TaxID=2688777 RepID=UPI00160135DC|nr:MULTISPECIES: ParA family protein [unclassified Paracoccus (in: a-proteobacteria)]MBB1492048.1 ParA family protein [Paracoccus sp. MC1854]MBB1497934.1 ParA family protein [Paracoccus sp. MC1862]QQO44324.1 ParA family protein [Paracoccus sp. MC1862]
MFDRTIIAITNQKGGVGKTTTAINLGAALAEIGVDVTIIDLDPQGNASTGLGVDPDKRETTSYDLLTGEVEWMNARHPTGLSNLTIVPATPDLASAELDIASRARRTHLLADALQQATGTVLIDCPPALGLLTLNAMVAADSVIVPLQAEFYALEGLSQLLLTIREVRSSANPHLRIEGVLLTMADSRNNLSQHVEADARKTLGSLVFRTVVPRNVRVSESPSHALPVIHYDPSSKGSAAYRALANELIDRNRDQGKAAHG